MKTKVEKHFDKVAVDYDYYKKKNSFYYINLKKLLSKLIRKNMKVFEIGCGTGDVLLSLNPRVGYGFDISSRMVSIAKSKHKFKKNIKFSTVWPTESFDFIFMTDVIEHLENPASMFADISKTMNKKTILINTMANPFWEPVLLMAEKLGLKMPEGPHKRITFNELNNIALKSGLKIVKHDHTLLMPIYLPFATNLINKYLGKIFKSLGFIEYIVAIKA
jgi:ubiquinone/menaquinone biosynthesis C-methylase UbiE